MKALWMYSLLRFVLFLGTYLVLWVVGTLIWHLPAPWKLGDVDNILVLFVALIVSSIAALTALGGQRDKLAQSIAAHAEKLSEKIEESRSAEDVD